MFEKRLRSYIGFFDRARFGCHLIRCVKNTLTLYSFYVIKSRVSRNFYRNIHRPFTPEKEVNRKENTVGKIVKRLQIRKSTHA